MLVAFVREKFDCGKSVELADMGGVIVFEFVVGLKAGCEVVMAELGVSGYATAKGPGV